MTGKWIGTTTVSTTHDAWKIQQMFKELGIHVTYSCIYDGLGNQDTSFYYDSSKQTKNGEKE